MEASVRHAVVSQAPGHLGPSVGHWLRNLLTERFGLHLDLVLDENSLVWRLSLPGSPLGIVIANDSKTFSHAGSDLPCVTWDAVPEGWIPILGRPLPAPGASALPFPLVEADVDGYTIHYDILGLVYWMLTRIEEVGATDLDEHGRFPARASHAYRHGYLERPIVDEWMDLLRQVIQRTWSEVPLKQQGFSMKVSHDVDTPSRDGFCQWRDLARGIAGDLLKRRDLRGLARPWIRLNTRAHLHRMDPLNTFDWLMDVSERSGLNSAFYFISERRGTAHDADYDIGHPAIRTLIRQIHSRGHEIGLHPSYGTYRDAPQIRREADRLRCVCAAEGVEQNYWGGRMHYLQWRQPDTLRAWNDAGMDYDSTLTYADHAGFRCGTCFEYTAFDPVEQKALNVRIRPLVVMEGSVFGERYMGLGVTDAAHEKMIELKDICRRVSGVFTLLWHNSSLQSEAERRMYEAVVSACRTP